MKKINILSFVVLSLFTVSCASTAKFPVSSVTPAADIVITKKKDKNGNYLISINAKNLASADRLTPAKKAYVVWITTKTDGVRNIGQLIVKNAKAATIETLTPFKFTDVFITAEDQPDVANPTGVEISRARFNK